MTFSFFWSSYRTLSKNPLNPLAVNTLTFSKKTYISPPYKLVLLRTFFSFLVISYRPTLTEIVLEILRDVSMGRPHAPQILGGRSPQSPDKSPPVETTLFITDGLLLIRLLKGWSV